MSATAGKQSCGFDRVHLLIDRFLIKSDLLAAGHSCGLQQFSGDGSDRLFFRCRAENNNIIVILPFDADYHNHSADRSAVQSQSYAKAMAEATACFAIGRHLYRLDIPVPKPYAIDEETGALIFEDLGHRLLHDEVGKATNRAATISLYRLAVDCLADFQIKGRRGFNPDWCWDTRYYDQPLMLERESHYFSREFCQEYAGLTIPPGLENDFLQLAARIAAEPADYLLHRDYQSRNLMMVDDHLRIIDFQGARFGPLGYDLASLLNDPYVNLAMDIRQELLDYYIKSCRRYMDIDAEKFTAAYYHIALQRNLQVLGAYAFLTLTKKKTFFKEYIPPAINNLHDLLTTKLPGVYPALQSLAEEIYVNVP